MEQPNKPMVILPQLVAGESTYKLVIPANVQKKIRACCYHSYNTEWSGTLFYTVEGSFEENNLVILVKDFMILDLGTSAHTEFETTPEISHYMVMNRLLDCKQGLIHSHNTMATFFSGEDTNTLRELGNDMAHFVSLIVNNAGTYSARITRKVTANRKGQSEVSYGTYNGQEVKTTQNFEESFSVIQWFNLDIDIQSDEPIMDEVKKRFEELKKAATPVVATPAGNGGYPYYGGVAGSVAKPALPAATVKPKETKQNKKKKGKASKASPTLFPENNIYTADHLNAAINKILTGSILATEKAGDMQKWVDEKMENKFDSVFGAVTNNDFEAWALCHLQTIIEYYLLDGEPNSVDVSEAASLIYDALTEYTSNPYIESFKELLIDEFILDE